MSDVGEILQKIERYNRLYGECSNGLMQMLVSAIYVISPVDIIPEALLGIFGLLDDLIIVFICFLHVAALYRAVLVTRHGGA
ncbi:UNVERIFIED_CONTAM: E3 ubiquitin-protein ligase [Sesamum calycinum]|uniref:E3 ubiquitin-protein ligase n=1 Tax=Sesamum calycinum TaxID=2727403 RepID=A0AAW2P774_9LAMI